MTELVEIRSRLLAIANEEALKCYRLMRRMEEHGCSKESIEECHREANTLYRVNRFDNVECLVDPFHSWRYAFHF